MTQWPSAAATATTAITAQMVHKYLSILTFPPFCGFPPRLELPLSPPPLYTVANLSRGRTFASAQEKIRLFALGLAGAGNGHPADRDGGRLGAALAAPHHLLRRVVRDAAGGGDALDVTVAHALPPCLPHFRRGGYTHSRETFSNPLSKSLSKKDLERVANA